MIELTTQKYLRPQDLKGGRQDYERVFCDLFTIFNFGGGKTR